MALWRLEASALRLRPQVDLSRMCRCLGKIAMRKTLGIIALTAAALLSAPVSYSQAEAYSGLVKQGYKTGKLSKNAAGAQGWFVSGGGKKYFCRMRATMAYVGSSGLVSILPNGRQIKLDRKTFEEGIGGPDPNIPQLSALKAGKLNDRDVGGCSAAK
jgi:hypothetical protein